MVTGRPRRGAAFASQSNLTERLVSLGASEKHNPVFQGCNSAPTRNRNIGLLRLVG